VLAVAADEMGNVFVTGREIGEDSFIGKYKDDGTLDWMERFDLEAGRATEARSVSADNLGNAYIAGATFTYPPDPILPLPPDNNVFLAKYDSAGNQVWVRHIEGDTSEGAYGIAVDSLNNAYITGASTGGLLLVSKYDPEGNLVWIDLPFTAWGRAIAIDLLGNVYVTGQVNHSSLGSGDDVFVSKYDPIGSMLWTTDFGSARHDRGAAIALDGLGNVYITGETQRNSGRNDGSSDVFVARLSPVPEPATIVMFVVGSAGLVVFYRKASGGVGDPRRARASRTRGRI
jgi:hypothetical protein